MREREREMETEAEGRRRAGGRGVLERGQRCSAGSNVTEETTGAYTLGAQTHTTVASITFLSRKKKKHLLG